jgi:hypothetical protein
MALEQCDEHRLDPFSDDVLGIRLQTAAWLEKIGNHSGAVKVLEGILDDCLTFIRWMEGAVAQGTADESGQPSSRSVTEGETGGQTASIPENLWRKRGRLLAKAVGTSVKLGELYSDEHVQEPENAQKKLVWAVETALRESQRRQTVGVKPEEGPWMSREEIGGALECGGHSLLWVGNILTRSSTE